MSGLHSGFFEFPPSLRKALPVSRRSSQCEAGSESLTKARGAPRHRVDNMEDLDYFEDTTPAAQELEDDYEDDNYQSRDYIDL